MWHIASSLFLGERDGALEPAGLPPQQLEVVVEARARPGSARNLSEFIRVPKGADSKAAALGMAYKLLRTAEVRWRRFNGHELVADVLASAHFTEGTPVPDEHPTTSE